MEDNHTHTLSGSLQTLTSVDFNESEEFLLGSCMDNSTRIWDLASSRIRVSLSVLLLLSCDFLYQFH